VRTDPVGSVSSRSGSRCGMPGVRHNAPEVSGAIPAPYRPWMPPVQVEMCLAGLCHGEVGAETLKVWKFPHPFVEAVRWHHRPERSPGSLASLLYLGEYWSDSDEDLSSCVRLRTALERAGVSEQTLAELGRKGQGSLESLRLGVGEPGAGE